MAHPLVEQLRFARSEFQRSLAGVSNAEARRRFTPINSISWMVGHLAAQELRYWVDLAQGNMVAPRVIELAAYGKPASTPPLDDMWADWTQITKAADNFLDGITSEMLSDNLMRNGSRIEGESIGTRLLRTTYHYWFHNGEAQAVRQLLGHTDLPQFVGDIGDEAPYRAAE